MVSASYSMQPTATNRARIMREMRRGGRRAYYREQVKDIATRCAIVGILMAVLGATLLLTTA